MTTPCVVSARAASLWVTASLDHIRSADASEMCRIMRPTAGVRVESRYRDHEHFLDRTSARDPGISTQPYRASRGASSLRIAGRTAGVTQPASRDLLHVVVRHWAPPHDPKHLNGHQSRCGPLARRPSAGAGVDPAVHRAAQAVSAAASPCRPLAGVERSGDFKGGEIPGIARARRCSAVRSVTASVRLRSHRSFVLNPLPPSPPSPVTPRPYVTGFPP